MTEPSRKELKPKGKFRVAFTYDENGALSGAEVTPPAFSVMHHVSLMHDDSAVIPGTDVTPPPFHVKFKRDKQGNLSGIKVGG